MTRIIISIIVVLSIKLSAQNVGINRNNPQESLDVNGNIRVNGYIKTSLTPPQAGQVLQADGDGTMSWASVYGYKNSKDFFNPDINPQTWTVPAGVTEIMVEMWGAGGGGSINFGGGGGAYNRIIREVTPGEVLTFDIGLGGTGIYSSITEATGGTATTFPSGTGGTHVASGGASGTTGLGGTNSIIINSTRSSYRKRGQNGKPRIISYEQLSTTIFIQKIIFGDGGVSGDGLGLGSGHGGVFINHTTFTTNIMSTNGRSGAQPGCGGGGGAGTISPVANSGGDGGDGYLIIHW